jgi:hypothetical protein
VFQEQGPDLLRHDGALLRLHRLALHLGHRVARGRVVDAVVEAAVEAAERGVGAVLGSILLNRFGRNSRACIISHVPIFCIYCFLVTLNPRIGFIAVV